MALTEKQKRFVDEYLVDLNATQAALRAGYSEKTAYSQGQRLLKNAEVQKAISEAIEQRAKRVEITQDWVVNELAKIASANGADFARVVTSHPDDGHAFQFVELVDTDEIAPDKRAAIASIEQTKFGIKVSSYDRVRALELLGKHLGLFEQRTDAGASAVADFIKAVKAVPSEVTALFEEDTDDGEEG